jgi:hypothetical protein
VRAAYLAVILLIGLAAGCLDMAALLPPARDVFRLETWHTVPEGQQEVSCRPGAELHLPLGPATDRPELVWLRVSINSLPVDSPEFHTSSKYITYVFRAQKPGQYHVEVLREQIKREENPAAGPPTGVPAPGLPLPRRADASWQPRAWNIQVVE